MNTKRILFLMALLTIILPFGATDATANTSDFPTLSDKYKAPLIFTGYRSLGDRDSIFSLDIDKTENLIWENINPYASTLNYNEFGIPILSGRRYGEICDSISTASQSVEEFVAVLAANHLSKHLADDLIYGYMIENPAQIKYAYWLLPEPPTLPQEDNSFRGYLKSLHISVPTDAEDLKISTETQRVNWLHTVNVGLQLSQAYVSANWYQGGTSYLAFLGNFLWDVQLNPVYNPKMMFQSTLSYKLSVNSTPDDLYHKYSISQDLFQYNLKTGYKAIHNWYYTFTMQFKTQFLHSYPSNSMDRAASFLSPGELNLGIGMTYSKENANRTLRFSASIAPLSYNFKSCIDPKVDHSLYGIAAGRKWVNEVGSNAEINFYAEMWKNATWTTRMFLFTDYTSFTGDWENTFNFQFTKLFSTQLYLHFRYDTSSNPTISKWKKFMLKEILSVGISYTFSTK